MTLTPVTCRSKTSPRKQAVIPCAWVATDSVPLHFSAASLFITSRTLSSHTTTCIIRVYKYKGLCCAFLLSLCPHSLLLPFKPYSDICSKASSVALVPVVKWRQKTARRSHRPEPDSAMGHGKLKQETLQYASKIRLRASTLQLSREVAGRNVL